MAKRVTPPTIPPELIRQLQELKTLPFITRLAEALEVGPTRAELRAFAAKKPGEWATLVKTLASLSGYADKQKITHEGVLGHIHAMSDAELLDHAGQLSRQKTVDITPDLCDVLPTKEPLKLTNDN